MFSRVDHEFRRRLGTPRILHVVVLQLLSGYREISPYDLFRGIPEKLLLYTRRRAGELSF